MPDFERNFYKASAVCPKCGCDNPAPMYIQADWSYYTFKMMNWAKYYREENPDLNPYPNEEKDVIPDKVVCRCRCGFSWEEKT